MNLKQERDNKNKNKKQKKKNKNKNKNKKQNKQKKPRNKKCIIFGCVGACNYSIGCEERWMRKKRVEKEKDKG
jgi:hypothetical protein